MEYSTPFLYQILVVLVTKALRYNSLFQHTREFTLKRNHLNATAVRSLNKALAIFLHQSLHVKEIRRMKQGKMSIIKAHRLERIREKCLEMPFLSTTLCKTAPPLILTSKRFFYCYSFSWFYYHLTFVFFS